jgi:SAM-dependent methyltransferase
MFDFEASYWWYRGLHFILLDAIDNLGVSKDATILDAGCGTGQNLANVQERVSNTAYGFDVAREATDFWRKRGLERVCRASINDIPFPSAMFDAAMSVDVLECEAVNEERAYQELWRVVKPGGFVILVVPAYQWLMTPEHHKAVGATRRYTRRRVVELMKTRPVEILRVTHVFAFLFPLVAAYRLGIRFIKRSSQGPPRSELKPLPHVVNDLLFRVVNLERKVLAGLDLPFGSSILAVARKVGA